MKLNPYLKEFWREKRKVKVLWGGRASSKTEDTAGMLIYLSSKYKIKVACVRKFQANIKQSVYSVLKKKIEAEQYFKPYFNFTDKNITSSTGSEFIFLGWERNTDQIKGLDDIDIMWIEEGHTLTKTQWQIIKDTILLRKNTAMVVIVFNPFLETDFAYKNFVLNNHPDVLSQCINYTNNPFLPETARESIEKEKLIMEEDEFNHIYLGYPKKDNEDAIIKRSWIEASIDAHKKLNIEVTGQKKVGYDVADDGNDKNAYIVTHGILAVELCEWSAKEDELRESALKVYRVANRLGATIIYDSIGVGAGVGSNVNEFNKDSLRKTKAYKFNAGAKVDNPEKNYEHNIKNKDMFANLKAQAWWNIADRFKATYNAVVKGEDFKEDEIISISSDINGLRELVLELSTPRKDFDNTGKVKVESKKDLAKRDIPSPNKADSFLMGYYNPKLGGLLSAMTK